MSTPPSQPPQAPKPPEAARTAGQAATPVISDFPTELRPVEKTPEYIALPQGKELNDVAA